MTMTPARRALFERDGFLLIRGALSTPEVDCFRAALDRVYAAEQAAGRVSPGDPMHLLSAVANCREVIALIDHPATFPLVWSVLGWNVHIYHSHLDVHPPITRPRPFRFGWHQDGGRQNLELDGDPRPRVSVKLAYWLSDVSVAGRGNLKVLPGSHRWNRIDGPPRRDIRWLDPEGAIEVCARPGGRRAVRPAALARPRRQPLRRHQEGRLLRLRAALGRDPRRRGRLARRRRDRRREPGAQAAARRPRPRPAWSG
jgi:hypothetical protein